MEKKKQQQIKAKQQGLTLEFYCTENLHTKICLSKEIILAENNFVLIDYGKKETTTNQSQTIGFDFGSSVWKSAHKKFDLIDIVKIGGSLRF